MLSARFCCAAPGSRTEGAICSRHGQLSWRDRSLQVWPDSLRASRKFQSKPGGLQGLGERTLEALNAVARERLVPNLNMMTGGWLLGGC